MQKELLREIEEMEQEVYNTQEEEEITEEVEVETIPEPVETKRQEEPKVDPPVDYEKRWKNYKASTDLTIRDLRIDLANSKTRYANLLEEFSKVKKQVDLLSSTPNKIFSEEDIDILGEPAVNALNKGVTNLLESQVKPLQDELERVKKENQEREKKEAEALLMKNYGEFLGRLAKIVPDYEEVNTSKGFLEYLAEADEASGYPRKYLFKKAEESLDVGRISSFFIDYKDKLPKNEEVLEAAITPAGNSSAPTSRRKVEEPMITQAYISKFYDDFARGKYKGKKGREEAARIEEIIDRAVFSGNIR